MKTLNPSFTGLPTWHSRHSLIDPPCYPVSEAAEPGTLRAAIAGHPFWSDLPGQYLPLLEGCASLEAFEPHQQIFLHGTEARSLYLIREGCVALETPFVPETGCVPLETVGTGDALGWSWFFTPALWRFNARALESTEVLGFNAAALRSAAAQNHDFGYELARRICHVMLDRIYALELQLMATADRVRQTKANCNCARASTCKSRLAPTT